MGEGASRIRARRLDPVCMPGHAHQARLSRRNLPSMKSAASGAAIFTCRDDCLATGWPNANLSDTSVRIMLRLRPLEAGHSGYGGLHDLAAIGFGRVTAGQHRDQELLAVVADYADAVDLPQSALGASGSEPFLTAGRVPASAAELTPQSCQATTLRIHPSSYRRAEAVSGERAVTRSASSRGLSADGNRRFTG